VTVVPRGRTGADGADAESGPQELSGPIGAGYRPHLDGLRAVAVYLVVAFHAGADRAAGGFIGVDVFFVLSGYLVTQLLVRDLRADGSIDLRRFYSRRVRRLLPAALLVLLVTMVVFSSIGSPAELRGARDAVRAAALYVSNWFFIAESNQYFGTDVAASPVAHFWSLSVEEQFYATWPLLLAGLHLVARRAGRRRWSVVQGVVLAGLVASLGAALWLARTDLDRAYYGTDTRAYQLLAGAMLALAPGALVRLRRLEAARRTFPAVALVALGGLLLLATDVVDVGPVTRGAGAAALTVALIAAMELAATGPVRRALSLPAAVYLGRISYGTYLWHWLVIMVMVRVVGASPLSTTLVAVLVATALAALSFELVERPVREARPLDRARITVVATGIAASLVLGLVAVPRLLEPGGTPAAAVPQGTAALSGTRVPDDLDWKGAQDDVADFPACTPDQLARCTLVSGKGPHVLLIGDSHARMLIPMFTSLARERHLSFSAAVAPVCPWQDGLQFFRRIEECRAHQADWYPTIVDELDPDIVVLAHRTFDDPANHVRLVDEQVGEIQLGSEDALTRIRARSADTLRRLAAPGRTVVILEPLPVAPKGTDPLVCLSAATFVEECRYVTHVGPTPIESLYRELADADPQVWALDLDRQVCPYLPICDPIVDGLIVKRDETHLTTRFATTLRDDVEAFLIDIGALHPDGATTR
jgi:peptidoglycan/LPS O-acetylase OafA/YrhL